MKMGCNIIEVEKCVTSLNLQRALRFASAHARSSSVSTSEFSRSSDEFSRSSDGFSSRFSREFSNAWSRDTF